MLILVQQEKQRVA